RASRPRRWSGTLPFVRPPRETRDGFSPEAAMRRITVPTVQAGHAIGVDLGGTKILAGVVARDGSVVRRHERPTPQDSQEHVLAELEAAVAELLDDSVEAVGFGAPAPIDQENGVVVRPVNLPLEHAPLRDRMPQRFDR